MKKLSAAAVALAAVLVVSLSGASSHREAPNIMLDPSADDTDTYAFTANDAPGAITVVANWVPGGNPANGPNFFRFDDRARYYLNFDNTGDGKVDIRDRYTFKTLASSTSFLYARGTVQSIDDPNLIQKQSYSIVRETYAPNGKRIGARTLARGLPVAPSNTGTKTFPDYGKVANQAIRTVGRSKVFVGQRNDAFFIDLAAAFDNLHERQSPTGNTGGGRDTQSGTSIQTITAQIPEEEITRDHKPVANADAPNATVGVWASTERRKLQVTNARFDSNAKAQGSWVQVSRLGNPLVNELFVPTGFKDKFNATRPDSDAVRIRRFIENPELALQLNELAPLNAPPSGRDDLTQVFLTGIPGLNQIDKANPVPADTLKLNMGVPPATNPNRFGVIGGDNAGFPNGRRLADDATDIVLEMAAGFMKGNKLPLGDGVDQDDKAFLDTFPYQSEPDNGFANPVSTRTEPPHAPFLPGNNPQTPIGPR